MNSDSKSIHFLNAPCFNCVKNYAKLTLKGQIPFGDQHITKLLTLTQLSSFYEPVTTPPLPKTAGDSQVDSTILWLSGVHSGRTAK